MASEPESTLLDEIVRAEGDGLFRFLSWSLGHREDALDALQEVLIRVHRSVADLRDREKLKPWLYRIATNVARDARARRRRRPPTYGIHLEETSRLALAGEAPPTPIAEAEALETDRRLALALERLSPELREPLVMHAVSGMKYREIAETLGWPIGTVTTRIHVARKALAEALRA